jgi:hypothetical protein
MSEVSNKAVALIGSVSDGTGLFSTIDSSTRAGKLETIAAISNAKPVNEHLDTPIALVNVILQAVEINDDKNPDETVDAVRTYLIDSDGNAYSATSNGIVGSLKDIFGILGYPNTWDGVPLPVKVIEERGKSGRRYMKIVLA